MSDVNTPRRNYHSPVRAEAARRTRRVIAAAAAAAELFVDKGYTATSLRDVAEIAGVARPTVTAAFGSKPALLRQVLDEALAGDDEPVAVAQRPWFTPVWEATDPAGVLDAYAGVCVVMNERVARVFETVHQAAGGSREIAELWSTVTRNRRFGAEMVIRQAALTGPLRDDIPHDHIVDSLWTLNDPSTYTALVLDRAWTNQEYDTWLCRQMHAAVLPHEVHQHGG